MFVGKASELRKKGSIAFHETLRLASGPFVQSAYHGRPLRFVPRLQLIHKVSKQTIVSNLDNTDALA